MQPHESQSQRSQNNINPIELGGISLLSLARGVNHRVINKLRRLMLESPLTPIVLDRKKRR